VLKKLR